MTGFADDLRYAVRSLVRRPSLTVFAALTVGLGVGATTAIFSTLEAVVLNPLPYERGDRIASLVQRIGTADAYVTPSADQVEAWAAQDDLFEGVEVWSIRGMTLTGRGEAREVLVGLIRPSFHGFVGRPPLLGRAFSDAEAASAGARVALMSYGLWEGSFGRDPGVVGQTLSLDGEPWTIIGVMPERTPMPGFGLFHTDVWRPLDPESARMDPFATAVLREGVDVRTVNARLAAMPSSYDQDGSREGWIGVARLVSEEASAGVRGTLALLMGAVVLLLLIACVNVSNLLLFRANARRRETAVRGALGGGRARLVRQLLLESLVLALCGGSVGIVLALVGQNLILELRPERLEVLDHVAVNASVLGFALLVTLGTGLVFGLVPALQAGRADALASLRSGTRSEGDVVGARVRWVLVAGEIALSFALLLGSLGILATLVERQRSDVGFVADELAVLELTLPRWKYEGAEERAPVFESIRERAAALPGVIHASMSRGVPPSAGIWFGEVELEGGEPLEGTQRLYGPSIDPEYFTTLGQRIVRGRGFDAAEMEGEEAVIVVGEETARRFFPGVDPVGRRFRMRSDGEWMTVIGVAEDVAMTGLAALTAPLQAYRPRRSAGYSSTLLARVASGTHPTDVLPLLREIAESVDGDVRIDRLAVAEDMLAATLDRERFATTIMATFAALALVLAAIGLYGVVSQVVGQRTREIGIRIALGAARGSIASMVFRRAGGATCLGIFLGVVLAIAATRFLGSLITEIESTDLRTYLLAAAALSLTSMVAAYAPARRASKVDPVDAMRVE